MHNALPRVELSKAECNLLLARPDVARAQQAEEEASAAYQADQFDVGFGGNDIDARTRRGSDDSGSSDPSGRATGMEPELVGLGPIRTLTKLDLCTAPNGSRTWRIVPSGGQAERRARRWAGIGLVVEQAGCRRVGKEGGLVAFALRGPPQRA